MVTDGILNLFYSIISPIVSVLPKGTLPTGVLSGLNQAKVYLLGLDDIVPIAAPMQFLLSFVLSSVMAFVAYRAGIFVYNKVRGS